MKAKLLQFVETVFEDAGNCEPPANYQRDWIMPEKGPIESCEEMELYLDQHRSVFDVLFPFDGLCYPPEWAEARVATSVCYILLGHPDIELDACGSAHNCEAFTESRFWDEDPDLPYRSLDDDQWGALLSVCLWSISEDGPVKQWEADHRPDLHREMRSTICRMVTSRHLPDLEDEVIAKYMRAQLLKLEQPDYAEAMKPPRY
jgi:hypothetical protein